MSNHDIFHIIDQAFDNDPQPSIGLSGGEAFLYYDDLKKIVSYATGRGGLVAINTNCFWADTPENADRIVCELIDLKVSKLVASFDAFHKKYIDEQCVINAIRSCKINHLEIELQFVASRKSSRMYSFLEKHADVFLNISCREIPCHPVGRAANMAPTVAFSSDYIPTSRCPNAVLSVSAEGNYLPCCNTAGHLPSLKLGSINESQSKVYDRFINSPVMNILWEKGPHYFIDTAESNGYKHPEYGYIDQCHLCYELFRDKMISNRLSEFADNEAFKAIYRDFQENLVKK